MPTRTCIVRRMDFAAWGNMLYNYRRHRLRGASHPRTYVEPRGKGNLSRTRITRG